MRFAIGSVLTVFGHAQSDQPGTATAGLTPAAESYSAQMARGIGSCFVVAAVVIAVVAIVKMLRARNTPTGPTAVGRVPWTVD